MNLKPRRRPWIPIDEACIDLKLSQWGAVPGQLPLIATEEEPDPAWLANTSLEPNLFDQPEGRAMTEPLQPGTPVTYTKYLLTGECVVHGTIASLYRTSRTGTHYYVVTSESDGREIVSTPRLHTA